ncbi:MAG: cyclase [candidate division NC10 bacterium]|nr:cyclase [candidate division NC10 bacterium]
MAYILIRHKVADFGKWKPMYEDHRSAREAAGLKDLHLWRNEGDPTEIIVLFEASDLAKAKEFVGSSDMKEKMQAAGVQGAPNIVFLSKG